ncbi:TPA: hypothetical protein OTQ06_002868 [Klebsiella aerogenes]|nr:hypothetical protein [Klebsiella aerogenes]
MSKSLNARCIRRWEVEFKGRCDSKYSPYWRKRDLRGYIREADRRDAYLTAARRDLNKSATNDDIDEEIHNELEAWND